MALQSLLLITLPYFLCVICIYPATVASYSAAEVKSLCSQTPYPQPCEYFLTTNKYNATATANKKPHFLTVSTQLALNRAALARAAASPLGSKCRNEREKAAWADCLKLYDSTIHRLNQTLRRSTSTGAYTRVDAQTWLSAALTNLETCRAGFQELGVADHVLPMMMSSNNVSELIRNTLALNNRSNKTSQGGRSHRDGFPGWVRPRDRKLLQGSVAAWKANVVVAKDGSGKFMTVGEAVGEAEEWTGGGRFVIHVKAGVYSENVEIGMLGKNVMLVGDGIGMTIITGNRSVGGGSTCFNSATVAVVGDGFIAQHITFRNTAGAANKQAVALRSESDLSVFYRCSFEGYQDTLYLHSERQFYSDSDIYGTVDFIFGNAAAVFQNCTIYARNPPKKTNTITAQGRVDPNQNTGISILGCRVTAADELKPFLSSVGTYLGRPWTEYSQTVFMETSLDWLIEPAGWLEWSGDFGLTTLYYGEYRNTGPGSSTANRVKWGGYVPAMTAAEASKFTLGNFISGGSWLPDTGVPFTLGL